MTGRPAKVDRRAEFIRLAASILRISDEHSARPKAGWHTHCSNKVEISLAPQS